MNAAAAGFEVLIPERGRPDLLAGTLAALAQARAGLTITHTVHVLVNGAPARDYQDLLQRHADVRFTFEPRALGFHGAIARLLAQASQPWVYLLNSDMRLHADALHAILPWRADDVFAIASQIEFADSSRRREETGYTVPVRAPDGQLELHDQVPVDASVRAHLYAGGGASIFQTALLRRYLARSHAFAPFYFEDADWGVQAWAEGYCVLYCPRSQAVHEHRATIGRYVPARTIEHIVQRNLGHFRWRYGDLFGAPRWRPGALERLRALGRSLRAEHRQARARAAGAASAGLWSLLPHQRFPHAQRWRAGFARVLLVAPSARLPGGQGARCDGIELACASAERIDWLLLQQQDGGEPQPAQADDVCFREIHPVVAAVDPGDNCAPGHQVHAQPALLSALQRLIDTRRPDLVCFVQIESVSLIEGLVCAIPIVWKLPGTPADLPPATQQRVRAVLHKVAALVLGAAPAGGHWGHRNERVLAGDHGATGMSAASTREWLELVDSLRRRDPPGA